jgi:hypothetical protein
MACGGKMKRFQTLFLALTILLSACASSSSGQPVSAQTPGSLSGSRCGDGLCEGGETSSSCSQDCSTTTFSGLVQTTYIKSENIGNIAVMIASPKTARYSNGAGIVVMVSPIFSEADAFMIDPDITSVGLIQVSYMWPGKKDPRTGVKSDGNFDYGGKDSTQVLTDVLRFAAGRTTDVSGRRIFALTAVPPLTDQVGVYAFSDAGIAAVNAFSINGDVLKDIVNYYIGRETPTIDTISAMELGYYDDTNHPVFNPFYVYPANYSPNSLTLNYSNLRWDPTYTDSHSMAVGRPYLDLDGNGQISQADFVFGWRVPVMFGKRYYSAELTKALLDNGALTLTSWPADLATPDEAAQAWEYRQSTSRYKSFLVQGLNWPLKVMLVFAAGDHLQVSPDKPHIHQAFQGFRFQAGLWVRLNPDRSYVEDMLRKYESGASSTNPVITATPSSGLDFPDNPANTQPDDWMKILAYAYPQQGLPASLVPLAAVEEMADRSYDGRWDENFGQTLYTYAASGQQP